MQGEFAILGYGSLIWDLEVLAPHVRLPWAMAGGPAMPMEFSRVSPKRKLGLVVVLDPDHGEPCPTHAIASVRDDIHAVADDLCARERATSLDYIGAVCLESRFVRSRDSAIAALVRDWCETVGARGAVWTDLPRNFETHTGEPFSLSAARRYLQTLANENLHEAVRYIDNAPPHTDTPLRRALAGDAWWRALPREEEP